MAYRRTTLVAAMFAAALTITLAPTPAPAVDTGPRATTANRRPAHERDFVASISHARRASGTRHRTDALHRVRVPLTAC